MNVTKRVWISLILTLILASVSHGLWFVLNKKGIVFEWEILVIFLVLGFLLFYKLLDYVADFKSVQHKSRIDIIFLVIFFVGLFIPMSHINTKNISEAENRTLTKMPSIIKKGKINYEFGKIYESWFNDRFFGRDFLIAQYFKISSIGPVYDAPGFILDKKSGFSYTKNHKAIENYQRTNLFSNTKIRNITKNVKSLKNYCDKHGIQLYVVLHADKETIYPEYLPKYYKQKKGISRYDQLETALKSIKGLNFISDRDMIMKAKKQGHQVFLKTDTHNAPNNKSYYKRQTLATVLQYEQIINKIAKNNPSLKPISRDRYEKSVKKDFSGNITGKSILSKKYTEDIELLVLKNPKAVEVGKYRFVNNSVDNNLNVVLVGDSFVNKYFALMAENFKNFRSVYIPGAEKLKHNQRKIKKLQNSHPDILILETTERFAERFKDMELEVF